MENIKEKIKKLLALSASPNENEAKAALLKARELMAKYKMEDVDFKKEEAKLVKMICEDIKWTTDGSDVWLNALCTIIADNYCCSASWWTPYKTRTHKLVLVGFEDDVRLCKEIILYVIGFINNTVNSICGKSTSRTKKIVKNSYAGGFIVGLQEAFNEQKEDHSEWGLVLTKSDKLLEYESLLGHKSVATKKVEFDPLSYVRGQNDGSNFNSSKLLSTT